MIHFRPAWDGFPEGFTLSSPRPASLIRAASHFSLIHPRLGFTACLCSWRGLRCSPAEAHRILQVKRCFPPWFCIFVAPLHLYQGHTGTERTAGDVWSHHVDFTEVTEGSKGEIDIYSIILFILLTFFYFITVPSFTSVFQLNWSHFDILNAHKLIE